MDDQHPAVAWADKAVEQLKRVEQAARQVNTVAAPAAGGAPGAGASTLTPRQVVQLFAEGMKSNNSDTQAAAIRVNDLATKLPQRAA